MLTDDVHYDYPPLMPGQKILEDNDLLMFYKKFSTSDSTSCLGWYFTLRGTEYCLTNDSTETFVSQIFPVADPLSGQDTCYVVGQKYIYSVYYKDGDIVVDLFPTIKEANQADSSFVFLPTVYYSGDDPTNLRRRVLYGVQCGTSGGSGYSFSTNELRDLDDKYFKIPLPFSNELLKKCIRFYPDGDRWNAKSERNTKQPHISFAQWSLVVS